MLRDAVCAFINECAMGSQPVSTIDAESRGHLRAWTITGAVLAIDALILHHLVMRRRRVEPRGRDRDQTLRNA